MPKDSKKMTVEAKLSMMCTFEVLHTFGPKGNVRSCMCSGVQTERATSKEDKEIPVEQM